MNLYELLQNIEYTTNIQNIKSIEISEICSDNRKVTENCIFVCVKGENFDSHESAEEVLKKGAACVVCERDLGLHKQIVVKNTRLALADISSNWFGNPTKNLKLIGVTGTNGKTTTTTVIKNILSSFGKKVGLIGTIQNEIGDEVFPTDKTTPSPFELAQLFYNMKEKGCEYVVMEVSSHALEQNRIGSAEFEIGVFTNLTQDHLDYHGTMENYFCAKKKLFEISKTAIINIDDPYGKRLAEELNHPETYSISNDSASFYAKYIKYTQKGVEFTVVNQNTENNIHFSMPGKFSVLNATAAFAVCVSLGFDKNQVEKSINSVTAVKGRSEIIPTDTDFTIMCDYAHTPDGLENILKSVKGFAKGRVIALFGCGGDRDRTKRPKMGEVAASIADYLVVTSDNPRSEVPEFIINDILIGVKRHNTPYIAIVDRKQAIEEAIKIAQKDDVIVLAGKGHEDYQVLATGKIHFDEREVVAEILDKYKA